MTKTEKTRTVKTSLTYFYGRDKTETVIELVEVPANCRFSDRDGTYSRAIVRHARRRAPEVIGQKTFIAVSHKPVA